MIDRVLLDRVLVLTVLVLTVLVLTVILVPELFKKVRETPGKKIHQGSSKSELGCPSYDRKTKKPLEIHRKSLGILGFGGPGGGFGGPGGGFFSTGSSSGLPLLLPVLKTTARTTQTTTRTTKS